MEANPIPVVVFSQVRLTCELIAESISRVRSLRLRGVTCSTRAVEEDDWGDEFVLVYDCSPKGAAETLLALEPHLRTCTLVPIGLGTSRHAHICALLGATVFLGWDASISELISVIPIANAGGFWVSPTLADHVSPAPIEEERVVLTARERQIAALRAQDWSYARIALGLNISIATVKNHLHHIYRKARANNSSEEFFGDRVR